MKSLTREQKAAVDIALEQGISKPSDLQGGFAWAALLPLLPLLAPLLKPVEKLTERAGEWAGDKIFGKKGSGFAPTGANDIRIKNPIAPVYIQPTRPAISGSGVSSVTQAKQLEALKNKLMPYTKSPDAFKTKLQQMIMKADNLKKKA